eukprot:5509112-Pleurochrysis_carterae.AAC.1
MAECRSGFVTLGAITMPMSASTVPILDVAISPRAGRNLAFLVWRVTRGIAALVPVARRRRLGTVVFAHLLGYESSALRSVQFYVPADLARFEIARRLHE